MLGPALRKCEFQLSYFLGKIQTESYFQRHPPKTMEKEKVKPLANVMLTRSDELI